MRGVKVFSGTSHPALAEAICQRLGTTPSPCDLGHFANGEIRVQIGTSIRNEDVFIVQSGSSRINDSVMEMLIMINACKGGSAKSITAVLPYFPYSRQSKKKAHRGAITAKMVANLMVVAGVNHVITVDLHSSQMQGFFGKPVDNLFAEPLIARWIRANVRGWRDVVVVSKNVGGTKRVTSLADALKVRFAIVSTDRDRRRSTYPSNLSMADSSVFFDAVEPASLRTFERQNSDPDDADTEADRTPSRKSRQLNGSSLRPKAVTISSEPQISTAPQADTDSGPEDDSLLGAGLSRAETMPSARRPSEYEANDALGDEKARDVIISRLISGHVVDDDHPSPALSAQFGLSRNSDDHDTDNMTASFISTASSLQADHALGGTLDAAATSDEEEEEIRNPTLEHTVTLVGSVKDRTAIIMDDIMDRTASWVAAAETCVKRGHAKKVYCVAIHALFDDEALQELEDCDCIDHIVVTNTFPMSTERLQSSKKLIVIDLSNLLSEAIRRNHHGETVSGLFSAD
ncbi:Ribose-phosphate pyrophosphokinase 1 [Cyphellophora attinorum]|uniref:Ribose-phosphate pyrophosphokinase 1 n=1 Tax=Cyphellophora attinorum TaxID=1664694 RepID=A0A0N1H2P4_9EURO|nr:Ribose-phosphate pyrophosphokinase 1 [Phialophora attinorum]KPI34720.1 Ribose-phosphate pyrophosphokinase 1 [Phialophora attinorum]